MTLDQLSYSIASGISVALTIAKYCQAEMSIIRTINIHILMNLMIKMINLIDVILYMTVMTDLILVNANGIPLAIE